MRTESASFHFESLFLFKKHEFSGGLLLGRAFCIENGKGEIRRIRKNPYAERFILFNFKGEKHDLSKYFYYAMNYNV